MKDKKCICIIHGGVREDYSDEQILGMQNRANELGYKTVAFSTLDLDSSVGENPFSLINFDEYDGVIYDKHSFLAHSQVARGVEKHVKEHCELPKVVVGVSDIMEDFFYNDNEAGFEAITDHLITVHECTKIYFLGGSHTDSKRRIIGFCNSIKKHGLDPEECVALYGGYRGDCAENFVRDLVSGNIEKPDAVVCVTDIVAYALIKECVNMGIRVPEDLRVCGYNAYQCAFNNLVPITTFPVNAQEVGERAMNRLHELITGESLNYRKKLPLSPIIGRSCGCTPQQSMHLRLGFAEADKAQRRQSVFKSGKLEEKLVLAQSVEDIRNILRNHMFLISNAELFSWNVMEDDGSVMCHYISKVLQDHSEKVEAGSLFPKNINIPDTIMNYYEFPLIYAGKKLGFVVTGYRNKAMIDENLKQFCHCLALGTMLLMQRD